MRTRGLVRRPTGGSESGSPTSPKTVADLHAPVSGTVADVNRDLEQRPDLVNADPYGTGWIALLETSQSLDDGLLSAAAYQREIEGR